MKRIFIITMRHSRTSMFCRSQLTWIVLFLVIFAAISTAVSPNRVFNAKRIIKDIEKDVGIEGMENNAKMCQDTLTKEGNTYYLFNSKEERIPGINPIEFKSLNDYREYVHWQRSKGIRCPVLELQYSHTVGGIKKMDGYIATGGYSSNNDLLQRQTSMLHFSREHTNLCGESSTIDPQFCINNKDEFNSINRAIGGSTVSSDGRYVAHIDGIVPSHENGVYPYDPMNQYIGVRTAVDGFTSRTG